MSQGRVRYCSTEADTKQQESVRELTWLSRVNYADS